jgi:hypothetical protein
MTQFNKLHIENNIKLNTSIFMPNDIGDSLPNKFDKNDLIEAMLAIANQEKERKMIKHRRELDVLFRLTKVIIFVTIFEVRAVVNNAEDNDNNNKKETLYEIGDDMNSRMNIHRVIISDDIKDENESEEKIHSYLNVDKRSKISVTIFSGDKLNWAVWKTLFSTTNERPYSYPWYVTYNLSKALRKNGLVPDYFRK